MQIYTRDFIEHRYGSGDAKAHYYIHDKPVSLSEDDFKDYAIRRVTGTPAVDLAKGPALIVCMGLFQTEDVTRRTVDEVRVEFESGRMNHTRAFIEKLAGGQYLEPVLQHLAEGLTKMCRGYFRLMDEVLCQPALLVNPPASYVLSYDSVEERAQEMDFFKDRDQSGYFTQEATDFLWRIVAPYLGQCSLLEEKGRKVVRIAVPKPVNEIIQRIENIVLVGNSTGGNFIVEVENALLGTLRAASFAEADIRKIMRSVRAVGIGQLVHYEALKGPRFTSIFFEGINDLVAQAVNPFKITLTEEDIRTYCPPRQQETLIRAAQEHFEGMARAFDEPENRMDAGDFPLSDKQLFIPRIQADKNRLLILTSVPTDRVRWMTNHNVLKPRTPPSTGAGDVHTEELFNSILRNVAKDQNGHHIGFYLAQGYPPFYLVELMHKILLSMLIYPFLPKDVKERFEVKDFLTKGLLR